MEQVVKVTRNYQITIPAGIRERAGIKIGDKVLIYYDEKEKVIKIKKINELDRVIRMLDDLPERKIDWKKIKKEYYEAKGNY